MGFFDWLKTNKKNDKIQVADRRQSTFQDAAMAATFAEAGEHETARSMIDRSTKARKILVIGHGEHFSEMLVEYAVGMAKRLDFELVALNISDAPLSMAAGKKEEAISLFQANSKKNVAALQEQAASNKVSFIHLVEIGHQDEVIEKLHAQHSDMRYVLTEPDPEAAQVANGKVDIPVFDMGCYQGMAA